MITVLMAASALIPLSDPTTWITSDDYPAEALSAEQKGVLEAILIVDSHGQPTGCTIASPTPPQTLASASCDLLMKRARFLPREPGAAALEYRQKINWKLTDNPIEAVESGSIGLFTIPDDGTDVTCKLTSFGDKQFAEMNPCDLLKNGGPFNSFLGQPLSSFKTILIRVLLIPDDTKTIKVDKLSGYSANRELLKISFNVTPGGFVKNCKSEKNALPIPADDICGGVQTDSPDFTPNALLKKPRHMTLKMDLWTQSRPTN